MPRTQLVFFKDDDGTVPVRDWLLELRRPEADLLRDGIYELRGRVNYRILYFFHGQNVAVLAHALTKEDKVSKSDIDRAVRRKAAFESSPIAHSYEEDIPDA